MAEWHLRFSVSNYRKGVSDVVCFSEIIKEILVFNKIQYNIWILYMQLYTLKPKYVTYLNFFAALQGPEIKHVLPYGRTGGY